jgi:hypothetical protein
MISSDPQTDYRWGEGEPTKRDGNRQVLFDAFSTSGNSGSPVFVAQRGIAPLPIKLKTSPDDSAPRELGSLVTEPFHEAFLVGINAGHFEGREKDHAGLSRLHKLSAIMDVLRANTLPSTGESRARILIPKDSETKTPEPLADT